MAVANVTFRRAEAGIEPRSHSRRAPLVKHLHLTMHVTFRFALVGRDNLLFGVLFRRAEGFIRHMVSKHGGSNVRCGIAHSLAPPRYGLGMASSMSGVALSLYLSKFLRNAAASLSMTAT